MDITKERIEKILAAGANVIFTTKGIDDVCMKVRLLCLCDVLANYLNLNLNYNWWWRLIEIAFCTLSTLSKRVLLL